MIDEAFYAIPATQAHTEPKPSGVQGGIEHYAHQELTDLHYQVADFIYHNTPTTTGTVCRLFGIHQKSIESMLKTLTFIRPIYQDDREIGDLRVALNYDPQPPM